MQVLIESETEINDGIESIICLEREDLQPENLGLTLAEAKLILAGVQKTMVGWQIEEYLDQEVCCSLWNQSSPP